MKVLFTITYYHPYISGLTIAASRWAEGLEKKGHIVTVLCMSGKGKGVVQATPLFKISKGFISVDWLLKSWQLVKQNDVIVVHLPQFEGVIPALFATLIGKKVIAVYHCKIVLPNKLVQFAVELSNRITILLSEHVVTYTRDYAAYTNLPKKTTYIVPPISMPQASRSLFKKRGTVIGVASRLAAEKGIEYILQALSLVKGTLVIAGPMDPVGEGVYKKKILALVQTYHNRVMFLDSIHPNHMGSFYQCIDVLVVPSVNSTEAFGMVQVEAMLSGVPVVASDLPGVRVPIMETGMGIVVPPRDSNALATAINTILAHKKTFIKPSVDIQAIFSPEESIHAFSDLLS